MLLYRLFCRSPAGKFLSVVMVMVFGLIVLGLRQGRSHAESHAQRKRNEGPSSKVLLVHTFPYYYEMKPGSHPFQNCPESRCVLSTNPKEIMKADGVIFFTGRPIEKPSRRHGQVWIYFAVEPPSGERDDVYVDSKWDNEFNWTMTYRFDSDIRFGYGVVHRTNVSSSPQKDFEKLALNKKKQIAWFVSNCNSPGQRHLYVQKLSKYIQVDIYGGCGKLKCGRNQDKQCLQMLERDYKFYLSFENALCKDYMTEKLYRMLKVDVLPVVRGRVDYKSYVPFNGYVDTSNFKSPKELAEHLRYLSENPREYAKYFSWRTKYSIEEPQNFPFCHLCERLHHPQRWQKVYKSAYAWWKNGACKKATDF